MVVGISHDLALKISNPLPNNIRQTATVRNQDLRPSFLELLEISPACFCLCSALFALQQYVSSTFKPKTSSNILLASLSLQPLHLLSSLSHTRSRLHQCLVSGLLGLFGSCNPFLGRRDRWIFIAFEWIAAMRRRAHRLFIALEWIATMRAGGRRRTLRRR